MTFPSVNNKPDGNTIAPVPGSVIDLSTSTYFVRAVGVSVTFSFSNVPNNAQAFIFMLRIDYTAGTITWPTTVTWPENTPPTLTASRTNVFMFITDNGGTKWRAASNANYTT